MREEKVPVFAIAQLTVASPYKSIGRMLMVLACSHGARCHKKLLPHSKLLNILSCQHYESTTYPLSCEIVEMIFLAQVHIQPLKEFPLTRFSRMDTLWTYHGRIVNTLHHNSKESQRHLRHIH